MVPAWKYADSKPSDEIKVYLMLIILIKNNNLLNLLELVFGIASMVYYA